MVDTQTSTAIANGIRAAKAGNTFLARSQLEQAVRENPNDPNGWLWLAWTAESPRAAIMFLEKALEHDPRSRAALAGMEWACKLDEFDPPSERNSATANSVVSDVEQAIDAIEAAAESEFLDSRAEESKPSEPIGGKPVDPKPQQKPSPEAKNEKTEKRDGPKSEQQPEPKQPPQAESRSTQTLPNATLQNQTQANATQTNVTPEKDKPLTLSLPPAETRDKKTPAAQPRQQAPEPTSGNKTTSDDSARQTVRFPAPPANEEAAGDRSTTTSFDKSDERDKPSVEQPKADSTGDSKPAGEKKDAAKNQAPAAASASPAAESRNSNTVPLSSIFDEAAARQADEAEQAAAGKQEKPKQSTSPAEARQGQDAAAEAEKTQITAPSANGSKPGDAKDEKTSDAVANDQPATAAEKPSGAPVGESKQPASETPPPVDPTPNAEIDSLESENLVLDALEFVDDPQLADSIASACVADNPPWPTAEGFEPDEYLCSGNGPESLDEPTPALAVDEPAAEEVVVLDAELAEAVDEDGPAQAGEEPIDLTSDDVVAANDERKEEAPATPINESLVMVIDPSATVRQLVASTFEKRGFDVLAFSGEGEALETIAKLRPAVVFLEADLGGADGRQLGKKIKKQPNLTDTHIVLISGKEGLLDKLRGKLGGGDDFLAKPFSPADLLKKAEHRLQATPVA